MRGGNGLKGKKDRQDTLCKSAVTAFCFPDTAAGHSVLVTL